MKTYKWSFCILLILACLFAGCSAKPNELNAEFTVLEQYFKSLAFDPENTDIEIDLPRKTENEKWQGVCYHDKYGEKKKAKESGYEAGDFDYEFIGEGHQAKEIGQVDFIVKYINYEVVEATYTDEAKAIRYYTEIRLYYVGGDGIVYVNKSDFKGHGTYPSKKENRSDWKSEKPSHKTMTDWVKSAVKEYLEKQ